MAAERPSAFEAFKQDGARTTVPGAQGQASDQFSYEMNALWGFDPREIETRNVAVWYAKDDTPAPPPYGEWLANHFSSKSGINVSVRDEDAGFGHFTYFPSLGPVHQIGEQTITKTLLDLCEGIGN